MLLLPWNPRYGSKRWNMLLLGSLRGCAAPAACRRPPPGGEALQGIEWQDYDSDHAVRYLGVYLGSDAAVTRAWHEKSASKVRRRLAQLRAPEWAHSESVGVRRLLGEGPWLFLDKQPLAFLWGGVLHSPMGYGTYAPLDGTEDVSMSVGGATYRSGACRGGACRGSACRGGTCRASVGAAITSAVPLPLELGDPH